MASNCKCLTFWTGHLWGYLSCVRLFVMCEAICHVWGYLSCVRLFVLCEAICHVWGYLSCVRLFVMCEAICPVWGYLSCVRLFVLCEAICPVWGYLSSQTKAVFWIHCKRAFPAYIFVPKGRESIFFGTILINLPALNKTTINSKYA